MMMMKKRGHDENEYARKRRRISVEKQLKEVCCVLLYAFMYIIFI